MKQTQRMLMQKKNQIVQNNIKINAVKKHSVRGIGSTVVFVQSQNQKDSQNICKCYNKNEDRRSYDENEYK